MRARNIKPQFFQNEVLTEIDFAGRLLFIGLWTLADREGRLEDRPKRIKMQLFAMDDIDVDRYLGILADHGFIDRYEVGDSQYIQIVNFTKHQRPHSNESASTIPPSIVEATANHGEQDGEPWEEALRSDVLIPDCLNADTPLCDEGADAPAHDAADDDDLSPLEWELVAEIHLVRGMKAYTPQDIVREIREANEARGSPVSDQALRLDAKRFRKHYTAERSSQPVDRKWRGGPKAVFNWFSRTREAAGVRLDSTELSREENKRMHMEKYGHLFNRQEAD